MKAQSLLKASKSFLKILSINLVILLLLLEGFSAAFYFLKYKQFFYTRKANDAEQKTAQSDLLDPAGIRLDESIVERLHPFLGYIYKPGVVFRGFEFKTEITANNYGFASPHNYPFIKQNDNQLIIGVFGGSVAAHFATQELEDKILTKALKKLPEFANKEIIVLSFAQGGYKQPQQLLALNYFMALGQKFDIVINIDGFNEVALSHVNHQEAIAVSMPSAQHVLPLVGLANNSLSTAEMASVLRIRTYKDQLKVGLEQQNACSLAACYTLNLIRNQYLIRRYQQEVAAFDKQRTKPATDQNSLIYLNPEKSASNTTAEFEKMASLWATASINMKNLLNSQNSLYFQFIQPNQYFPTQRVFTDEEKTTAIRANHPYAEGVKQGYPILLKKVDQLKQNQVNIFNAINVLDAEKSTVYIDDCCHYNQRGREIFANYIAQSIVDSLKKSDRAIQPAQQSSSSSTLNQRDLLTTD